MATIYADHIPATQERIEYWAYDQFGKMTNHWGAATYDVAYAFDMVGNQVSLTDGNRNTTRWEYDGRNRKIRKIYADNSDYEYGYDFNDNQTHKRDAMQRTTRYEFNAYNLLVGTDYPNDPDVAFGYDPAGRRVMMVDGTGTNTWSYDAAGRVLNNAQFNVQHVVGYTYDSEGNRLSMTVTPLAGGDVWRTDYAYDTGARLENITDRGVSETPFHYTWATNAVRLAALTYPSGLKTTQDYDAAGRTSLLLTRDHADVEITRFGYGYDKAGLRTNETTQTHTDRFKYDAKRQLVSGQRYDLGGKPDLSWNFDCTYDPVGNRSAANDEKESLRYTANNLNQYVGVTSTVVEVLGYDANGNLRSDGKTIFTYNEADQLTFTSNVFGIESARYDGLGRLVRITIDFCLPGENVVYDGSLAAAYVPALTPRIQRVSRGLDFGLSRDQIGGVGGVLAVTTQGLTSELVADARGNIRFEFNGTIRLRIRDYSAFGMPENAEEVSQPFGFSSKERFGRFGLQSFGKRCYAQRLGRWLNRDPVGEYGTLNLYAFVGNNGSSPRLGPRVRMCYNTGSYESKLTLSCVWSSGRL